MFFDPLESRCMFSVTIPTSTQLTLANPLAGKLPATLTVAPAATTTTTTTTAAVVSAAVTAAQSKDLASAVLNSEINLLSDVFAGRLNNLQTDLGDLKTKVAKAGSQLQNLLGSTVAVNASLPSSQLGALRGLFSTGNPLSNLLGTPQINGDRNSQVSSDPSDTGLKLVGSTAAAVKVGADMGALPVTAIFGGGGAGAGAVATATGGVAAAAGAGVIVGTVIDKGVTAAQGESIGQNWGDVYGASYYNATGGGDIIQAVAGWLSGLFSSGSSGSGSGSGGGSTGGTSGTPLPDDASNGTSSGIITAADLKGFFAKLNGASQPANTDDTSSGGTGGALNTGASGTGKVNSVAQYSPDSTVSTNVSITARDLATLAVRLTSKITTIH
jgi:hypothetical protein